MNLCPITPGSGKAHWLEAPAVRAYRTQPLDHPLLGRRIYGPGARWEAHIDLARLPDLADHRIRGDIVMPAAAYVEQMLAVGHALFGNVPVAISHLELDRMLILDRPRWMNVERNEISGRTIISSEPDGTDAELADARACSGVAISRDFASASLPGRLMQGKEVSVDELYRRLDDGRQPLWSALPLRPQLAHRRPAGLGASCARSALRRRMPSAIVFIRPCSMPPLQVVLELLRVDDRLELYLPVGVDRIEVSRAVGSEAYCLVRNAYRGDSILGADIFIYDQSHAPIAVLQGCRCRAIEASSPQKLGHTSPRLAVGAEARGACRAPALVLAVFGFQRGRCAGADAPVRSRLRGAFERYDTNRMTTWSAGFVRPVESRCKRRGLRRSPLAQFIQQLAGSDVRLHLVTEGATVGHAANDQVNIAAAAVWARGTVADHRARVGGEWNDRPRARH